MVVPVFVKRGGLDALRLEVRVPRAQIKVERPAGHHPEVLRPLGRVLLCTQQLWAVYFQPATSAQAQEGSLNPGLSVFVAGRNLIHLRWTAHTNLTEPGASSMACAPCICLPPKPL